ncbi:unnamed protein product, partial [Chrysoparadoxa australica]
ILTSQLPNSQGASALSLPRSPLLLLLVHQLFTSMEGSEDIEQAGVPPPPAQSQTEQRLTKAVSSKKRGRRLVRNRIPDDILNDAALAKAITLLPSNYHFEVPKTVWKIRVAREEAETAAASAGLKNGAKQSSDGIMVALQLPEGLQMYACVLADILEKFAQCKCTILGDVTYGACCISDLEAKALGCSLLVHYGHSCLVPVSVTCVKVLYVFVEISVAVDHLVECVKETLPAQTKIAVLGTIQFSGAVHNARAKLAKHFASSIVDQAKPLSPGEVLGCTSPVLTDVDALVFIADGRFHLESAMIQNPTIEHYRYNPYNKVLSRERYDTAAMKSLRWDAIQRARSAGCVGVILGTLGRQGNPQILNHITSAVLRKGHKQYFIMLLSEIFPAKLEAFTTVEAWVQATCPRLSVDWGHHFSAPLLSAYEAEVAFAEGEWAGEVDKAYPMDYYRAGSGPWSNMHVKREF